MYIIHFPRAAIHQHALLRASRTSHEKFPPAAKESPNSFKINSDSAELRIYASAASGVAGRPFVGFWPHCCQTESLAY